ncbi:MAG: geranyl transferase [Gammaproteobacteria bacterium RIFCSPHIGHO2_12_FULL_63_22]|nr:MAG: geranyl transferase [Gammaproteobacteria bacterium RIFCSPHIGHO2_12_FULL_63_22]
MAAEALIPAWRDRVEVALQEALSRQPSFPMLQEAMRHAVLGGGKRLRPLLVYAAGRACNADEVVLDGPAVAVELIHAFSLVHDDLPAMDDDSLRRGQPTVHVAFDEATAILAGDALQSLAFSILADAPSSAAIRVLLVRELAQATGAQGMCGGQAMDMAATGATLRLAQLEQLHSMKTGALIRAAVRMGALSGGASNEVLAQLDTYADALGLAFQIRDDILDVEGDAGQLGKTAGKDAAQGKSTYPGLLGLAAARERLAALDEAMQLALAPLGANADALRMLAQYAIARAN